jgi:hypothetical protein
MRPSFQTRHNRRLVDATVFASNLVGTMAMGATVTFHETQNDIFYDLYYKTALSIRLATVNR